MQNVIALSIMYVKHPNKHNNQQFNVNEIHVKGRADQMKRFAPFSYLNHSAIESKHYVYSDFVVFYLLTVMLDKRFVHQLHIFMFLVSSR